MSLEDAMRQMSRQLELPLDGLGESPTVAGSGEASTATRGTERSGSDDPSLMERVVERDNVIVALKRVQKKRVDPASTSRKAGAGWWTWTSRDSSTA